jgi:hypothetical protein
MPSYSEPETATSPYNFTHLTLRLVQVGLHVLRLWAAQSYWERHGLQGLSMVAFGVNAALRRRGGHNGRREAVFWSIASRRR